MRAALENPRNELWLSPISTWEFLVLCKRGRLAVEEEPQAWLARAFSLAPLREAPLTHEVAIESHRVRLPHRDPADHFIAATARVFGLTLATADERLIRWGEVPVVAN